MRVAVVDCGSSKSPTIADILRDHGAEVALVPLRSAAAMAQEAVVISGGPRLFTEEPRLIEQFTFIDALSVPMLGICLGHQALAMRHGAEVHLGPERRCQETVEVLGPHPLFAGLSSPARFTADHCEGVALPSGWQLLAESSAYAVEAMAHPSRALFGVQFHPEVSGDNGRRLLGNFLTICAGRA